MGVWEETCALTLQPIFDLNECVVVLIKDQKYYSAFGTSGTDLFQVEGIYFGSYDSYGWICETPEPFSNLGDRYFVVFFHKQVWDNAIKFYDEKIAPRWKQTESHLADIVKNLVEKNKFPGVQYLLDLEKVVAVACQTRRCITNGARFRGHQDHNAAYIYKFLHEENHRVMAEREMNKAEEENNPVITLRRIIHESD